MNNRQLRLAALSLIIWGMILGFLGLHKRINLVVDGQAETHTTFALTVGGFLKGQNQALREEDQINLQPSSLLREGQTVRIRTALRATLVGDGDRKTILTTFRKPANILGDGGMSIFPKDIILVNGNPAAPDQPLSADVSPLIQIRRATPITLQMEEKTLRFTSQAETLSGALWEHEIPLYQADLITPAAGTPLDGSPLHVRLERSQPFQIQIGENVIPARSISSQTGSALADAGITLQGGDYSQPAEDQPVPENGLINVIRVDEEIILKQDPLEFTSQFQPTNELALDERKVLDSGSYGLKAQRIRVRYENGEEVSRAVEKEWVVKEPEPRIIGYGTDIEIRTVETPDGPIRVWREIDAFATSYNESCPGCDSITASGSVLKKGVIAVTLEWYRYMQGLQVYIPGYGFGRIEDVGGGLPGKFWVDLGYKKKNYVPWSQNVTVYFLAPPPPPENIMYVLY